MKIDLSVSGLDQAVKKIDSLKNIERELNPVLKITAIDLGTYARKRIRPSQADNEDYPFAPLSESTIESKERRKKKNQPILIDSGRMFKAFIARAKGTTIEFGSAVPYYIYHQYGTKKKDGSTLMPKRAVFPVTRDNTLDFKGSGGKIWRTLIDKIKRIPA